MLLIQQFVNSVMLGSVYVTVAVAFTLTIGVLNFLNFTIPGLFMLTAMLGWAVLSHMAQGGSYWIAALALGTLGAIAVSLLVERFAYRYLNARYGDATEHAI